MRIWIVIFYLLASIFAFQAYADTINGHVINHAKIPVISYIKVFNRDNEVSDSLQTDILGNFHAKADLLNTSYLLIYSKGYAPLNVASSEIRIDSVNTFILEKDSSIVLNEIQVYAPRNISTLEKTIIYPEKQILSNNHSSLGVLQDLMLPGLEINNILQTATIYGKKIIFKINGIPKPIESVLALSPNSIYKIEYSNSLSIKESTNGAGGIINIILKDKDYGISLYNSIYSAVTTGMVNETLGLSLNKGNHQVSLDYNLQYRSYYNSLTNSSSEFLYETSKFIRSSFGKSGVLRMCLNNIYASYAYNRNNTQLSFSFGYLFGPWQRRTLTENIDLLYTSETQNKYQNYKNISQPYSVPAIGLSVIHKFKNDSQLEYNLTSGVNSSHNTWSQEYSFDDGVKQFFENIIYSDTWDLINEISWNKGIGNYSLKLGLNESYANTRNKYKSTYEDKIIRLKENELFPYFEFAGKFKNFNYSVGTGLYYINRKNSDKACQNILSNYSTLRLFFNLQHGLNISGTMKYLPTYPSLGSLAEFFLVTDNFTATKGNPNIKPSSSLISEANISYTKGSFSSYLRFTYNKIWNPFFSTTSYQHPYYVSMVINGDNEFNYSIGLNLQYRKFLDNNISYGFKLYAELQEYCCKTQNDTQYQLCSYYISGNGFINYKNWTLALSGNSKYKSLSGEVITKVCPYSNISLSYKWKFFNFSLVAAWLGNRDGDYKIVQSLSKFNPSVTKNLIRDNANCIGIAITYRFDYGKKSNYSIQKRSQSSIQNKSVQLIE